MAIFHRFYYKPLLNYLPSETCIKRKMYTAIFALNLCPCIEVTHVATPSKLL